MMSVSPIGEAGNPVILLYLNFPAAFMHVELLKEVNKSIFAWLCNPGFLAKHCIVAVRYFFK